MSREHLGAVGLLALLLMGTDVRPLPAPHEPAWEEVRFPRAPRPSVYRPVAEGGVRAEAECGASARVHSLAALDLAKTPLLRWRWRVVEPLRFEGEQQRSGDDFAARVYVLFAFDPGSASLARRARWRLGSLLFGRRLPGSALSFVWTQHLAPGTVWANPYANETIMGSLRRGGDAAWQAELVDLPLAYRRAFGRAPARALALGIMTDADDRCQRAVAEYADFRLTSR